MTIRLATKGVCHISSERSSLTVQFIVAIQLLFSTSPIFIFCIAFIIIWYFFFIFLFVVLFIIYLPSLKYKLWIVYFVYGYIFWI